MAIVSVAIIMSFHLKQKPTAIGMYCLSSAALVTLSHMDEAEGNSFPGCYCYGLFYKR
jgi:hypothetical protein